ncbi:2-succinyl-5-enolpyruvyl-6-hydroxy-3-cyclohexene-1-carboxylic-acid synthase [Gilvibacter sp.]|uniref:2-succinyl-5-enolpyruvyl-6-hydroxy-3- cyclohexene-1-carboxylic-acid synthase n=1 Tax=Gilvibacter sp. TaxID=2729997 RepID=UPI003B528FC5
MSQKSETEIYPAIPLAQLTVAACKAHGISRIVISPGSRNAPLTLGFTRDSFFECYSIVDERVAAFFALGMAQQTGTPVAIVCTSGSAVLNYFPAVAEAYYSQIPLVVLSADRPPHKIDIGDGQTIKQAGLFGQHVGYAANCIIDCGADSPNFEFFDKALNTAWSQRLPVHLNLPFEEPLYNLTSQAQIQYTKPNSTRKPAKLALTAAQLEVFNAAERIMVLCGVMDPDVIKSGLLDAFLEDPRVLMLTETTSNLHHPKLITGIDQLIAAMTPQEFESLQPDLLISFGGMVVSKKIKAFLRQYAPKTHWHVDPLRAYDTFFVLSEHIAHSVNDFLTALPKSEVIEANYQAYWLRERDARRAGHKRYLERIAFSDLTVYGAVFKALPESCILHIANSAAIRYAQLFELPPAVAVYCNRGTSGIDGSTSTAIGAAVVADKPVTFISGDLSFFYDSNALWNAYTPNNFKVVLVNNQGGGIFRILPGDKHHPDFSTYFETVHGLSAEKLCALYGWEYYAANDQESLEKQLGGAFSRASKPALLEVTTPRTLNDELLLDYFKSVRSPSKIC